MKPAQDQLDQARKQEGHASCVISMTVGEYHAIDLPRTDFQQLHIVQQHGSIPAFFGFQQLSGLQRPGFVRILYYLEIRQGFHRPPPLSHGCGDQSDSTQG